MAANWNRYAVKEHNESSNGAEASYANLRDHSIDVLSTGALPSATRFLPWMQLFVYLFASELFKYEAVVTVCMLYQKNTILYL